MLDNSIAVSSDWHRNFWWGKLLTNYVLWSWGGPKLILDSPEQYRLAVFRGLKNHGQGKYSQESQVSPEGGTWSYLVRSRIATLGNFASILLQSCLSGVAFHWCSLEVNWLEYQHHRAGVTCLFYSTSPSYSGRLSSQIKKSSNRKYSAYLILLLEAPNQWNLRHFLHALNSMLNSLQVSRAPCFWRQSFQSMLI